ncbi:MAG TPA: YbaB/EbfC family nucleoid-associated protein [Chloroflexota bacterium]|jgi:DNA-binding protein YbaB|nr:YbaB/EbfC family nucleoid-associated protein [Chloroflexota bacterium]
MSDPLQDKIEQAFADFERTQAAITTIQDELAEGATTVTSKNRAVQVTVDGHGDVSEIKFPTKAYRTMAPAELGSLLVTTLSEARRQAVEHATNLMRTTLPDTAPLLRALGGSDDFETVMEDLAQMAASPSQTAEPVDETDKEGH